MNKSKAPSNLAETKPLLDRKGVKAAKISALVLVSVAFLLNFVVLVGWLAGIDSLRSWLYGQTVGFPTAVWIMVLCLGCIPTLLNVGAGAKINGWRIAGRVVTAIVFLICTILWCEHVFGLDLSTASSFYELPFNKGSLSLPGPMPVDVSFVLALLSLCVLALDFYIVRFPISVQVVASAVALPSLFIVASVLYGQEKVVDHFCAWTGCVRFKFLNYLSFLLIATGFFLSRPEYGLARLLFSNTTGGSLFRTSFLAVPLASMYVWLLKLITDTSSIGADGKKEYLLSPDFFLPLALLGTMIIMGVVFAVGARKLEKVSEEKEATEQVLAALSQKVSEEEAKAYKMVCLSCGKEYPDGWLSCPYDSSELSRVADRFAPGSLFADKYEIVSMLGAGGMSTVYKANHKFLSKAVAIKLLNAHLASDGKAVQRFQAEAKAAFDLSHPNLIGVYDFGISPDGQAYIVMDYLSGESLEQLIERKGKLSLLEALPIFVDVAEGLAYAHGHSVLHRDIKPSNVMLVPGENGKVRALIVDFGLAKNYDENSIKLTQTGEIFGSPLYMSPEQCRGADLDHRSDIYSLGCLMYETLSGNVPIRGASAYETFRLKFSDAPKPFDETLQVPPWLNDLVISCLHVDAEQRPSGAKYISHKMSGYVSR